MEHLLIIIAFFIPLVSSISCAILTKVAKKIYVQIFSLSTVIYLSCISLYLFFTFDTGYAIKLLSWINVGDLKVDWVINIDRLSVIMFVVISIVSLLVRIYSFGYMANDPGKLRFFSYLSLFAFAMLILVASNNFVQLFVGWEGVGLCSYLLIGFWFKKKSANDAAIKAFIVNRVADVFLVIGISAIYSVFGSLNFSEVFPNVASHQNVMILGFNAINFICFMLFVGCMGKSAQIGFHVWLPDAMEGPTPISALIHSATMVTAGVFLVARTSHLFQFASAINEFMIIIAAITAIFSASIACFQNDIKRIIAYSTCSQLGYMFIACGMGAYNVAMFHLVTHAFFKALLFLSSGSVIHAMNGEQDIYKMEPQLWKKIPHTYLMFWIGSLALAGIFPFAGYYSKDLIIESAYGVEFAFATTLVVTVLTALYSWRLILVTFHKKEDNEPSTSNAHESPFIMLMPLYVLAFLSIISGFVAEHFMHILSSEFWKGALIVNQLPHLPLIKQFLPTLCALLGMTYCYVAKPVLLHETKDFKQYHLLIWSGLLCFILYFVSAYLLPVLLLFFLIMRQDKKLICVNLIKNKYYIDEMYQKFITIPLKNVSNYFWREYDVKTIDGVPNYLASIAVIFSRKLLKLHNGYIYNSASMMLLGLISFISFIIISSLFYI